MTLSTHALVGAAVATLFPTHPAAAFVAGFASHLAIDSLPHWDYKPRSLVKNYEDPLETNMTVGKDFLMDFVKIALDAIIGASLAMLIFYVLFHVASITIIMIGVVAGILPDPLQFVYWKTRTPLLLPLQRFHIWVQKGKNLEVKPWIGISLQVGLVIIISAAIFLLRR